MSVSGKPRAVTTERKKKPALEAWKDTVRKATAGESRMTGLCQVHVDFVLPRGSYRTANRQMPYGSDVDNLAAAVLDALKEYVVPEPAGDGAVMELLATKREAGEGEEPGVLIVVIDLAPSDAMLSNSRM